MFDLAKAYPLSYEPDLCSTLRVFCREIVSIQRFDPIETQATACVHIPFVRSQHIPHILMLRNPGSRDRHLKILRDHLSLRVRYDALLYLCSSYENCSQKYSTSDTIKHTLTFDPRCNSFSSRKFRSTRPCKVPKYFCRQNFIVLANRIVHSII